MRADMAVDGLSVRVRWAAIMRRIRWAARLHGLVVPDAITIRSRTRGRCADPVQAAGDCTRTGRGYLITVCTEPAWLAGVEEVLVHEVAHAVAWGAESQRPMHTPAWAACYGAIYAAYFDRSDGPPRPGFVVRRRG